MLNKYFKTIHNKHSKFLRFIFFLRYLFAIFFIFTVLFLTLPSFFDYEKNAYFIKKNLSENYDFNISTYEKIKFRPLPVPSLEIKNATIDWGIKSTKVDVKNLKVYPKIFSIYNPQNFQVRKIFLKDSKVNLDFSNLNILTKRLLSQKNKIFLKNLNIKVADKNKSIFTLENLEFANFGYKKNLITGRIFEKNFRVEIDKDQKKVSFKLLKSGLSTNISFDTMQKANFTSGVLQSKILNTNIKFNFDYNGKKLKIYNSYFRNKSFSFKNDTIITLKPFLDFESKFNIEKFDVRIFKKNGLFKLMESKDVIKKINSRNEINFKAKKFINNFIDELKLNIDLAYGRIDYSKNFSISENVFKCSGNINILEEFPLLFFNCSVSSDSKKKLLKLFLIKIKDQDETFLLTTKGNLNLFNNKINFKEILLNNNYKASKEDLKYFKKVFEYTIFDKGVLEMFSLKKIKKFILEIS